MWKIKHIFDGEYGCEENTYDQGEAMVSVTLINEKGEETYETVADVWLQKNHLDVGSEWPDYSNIRMETECGFSYGVSHDEYCVDKRNGQPYVLEHNVLKL